VVEPESDIELAQNGIEFASRLLSKWPSAILVLAPTETMEFFFDFTLKVLDGNEPLPKAAAAEFWVRDDKPLGARVQWVKPLGGPFLADCLARLIS
jgi:hypothetical protein